MTLLVVDVGNTDTVLGIWQADTWSHVFRTPSQADESAQHYERQLRLYCLEANISLGQVECAVLSSVVPGLTPVLSAALLALTGRPPIVVGPDIYPPVRVAIDQAEQIGSDLVANAVAAYEMYKRNTVVVDFGTALTFTTVSADGEILGVAIAPGLRTAVRALFSQTAQLPEVPLHLPNSAIGKNTTHAIQAGILLGYESLVSGMIARIRRELGGDCIAVATGGLSAIISSLANEFTAINPHLTLDGLRLIGIRHIQSKI